MMKIYKKAILPLGFTANGLYCGIKKSKKLDLALLCSQTPALAACFFTSNAFAAAPVRINQEHLKHARVFKAIIVNSGNANAFNKNSGLSAARETVHSLAEILRVRKENVLVASTGVIGRPLPVAKIKQAIPYLVKGLSRGGIDKAKLAILTTDTFPKEISVKCDIGGQTVTICGIAKGAGMIAPNLACSERSRGVCPERSREATMLCFILTDARITQRALNLALLQSVENSFNCITVDGCMSTNDSVMMLANGAAANKLIDGDKNLALFLRALQFVCLESAKLIVKDAEGATKFIRVRVMQAKDFAQARKAALNIANSNLFKCAIYGENPNFGRIAAAVGASGIDVSEKDLKIKVSPLQQKEIKVEVWLKRGNASATVYTSDLTPEYIKINADYN